MLHDFSIRKPFFEFGPKVYLYGEEALELALWADELVGRFDVDIIFTAQYTDIERIAARTKNIRVFAQHMDPNPIGRGIGAVLAEALKYAGAQGVLLNHAERPLTLSVLGATINRAAQAGLATLVSAGTVEESAALACLAPDIILAESPALIGAGKRGPGDRLEIEKINRSVRAVNPNIPVLHAAGITDENDVYQIILAGADATGSTSGVLKAPDPKDMLRRMIEAVAAAYRERITRR